MQSGVAPRTAPALWTPPARDTVLDAMHCRTLAAVILALAGSLPLAAAAPKPPAGIVFPNTAGDVPFNHKAHIAREKKCATCHDKLFPMSTREPLASSAACRTCHHPKGRAFDTKDAKNCKKCHPSMKEKQD